MKPSRSRHVSIRGLRYHLREWGEPGAPLLLMLHGWMDISASFQFVVDAFERPWHVVAPDWRGFGRSQWGPADCYWFPDYLADLDALLDRLAPARAVEVVGHSMGGNVAMLYAGIRPQRVRRLVNLEGLGLRDGAPETAPARYRRWLDELREGARLRDYASVDAVAARLQQNNPRLSAERAAFLAPHWSEPGEQGRLRVAGDPAHRLINPVLYRWAEAAACWRAISAPVLWVEAELSDLPGRLVPLGELEARRELLPGMRRAVVPGAGHMMHHEQPEVVAALIEQFLHDDRL
jgi:pimeloyl-ACP methyl ester carboxylesterase